MPILTVRPVCTIFKSKHAKVSEPKKRMTSPFNSLETLGGRLAMQGSLWGGATKIMMNETLADQVHNPHCMMTAAAVTSLVTLGTLVTNRDIGDESYYSFTPDAETLNGRGAMMVTRPAATLNL